MKKIFTSNQNSGGSKSCSHLVNEKDFFQAWLGVHMNNYFILSGGRAQEPDYVFGLLAN